MDPSTGRFISADRKGLRDGPNQYLYAHGAPTFMVDPMGDLALVLYGSPNFPGNDTSSDPFVAVTRDGRRVAWSLNDQNRYAYRDAVKRFVQGLLNLSSMSDVLAVPFFSAGDVSWAMQRKRYFDSVVFLGHATRRNGGQLVLDFESQSAIDSTDFAAIAANNLKEQGHVELIACNVRGSGFAASVSSQLATYSFLEEVSMTTYAQD